MRALIAIARITRPQGLKGEVLAEILTDFPSRFADLQRAFLEDPGKNPQAVTVEHTWLHKGKVVLKFAGIGSIDDAETLRGRLVLVPEEERVALSADQYYLWELEGCQVVAESGGTRTPLGMVTEVERIGGADLLHVADGSREILIPFVRAICKVIDPASRLIVIDPPEDLLDLNRE
ncbi:MAG TPA: ribosome maturation factor RimM [Terriglobia bacterium]|nr:ribosome maturation factor RimM [Terriglobia bacterium]